MATYPAWLEVQTVAVPIDASLAWLNAGEREAIRLAAALAADALIIDEPAGRKAAQRRGIRVIGTLRVFHDALKRDSAILLKPMSAFSTPPFEPVQTSTELSLICTAKGESDL